MEIFKFTIIPTEEYNRREQYRHSANKCAHCHHPLEFTYQQDVELNLLQEEAHCPACHSKRAASIHRVN